MGETESQTYSKDVLGGSHVNQGEGILRVTSRCLASTSWWWYSFSERRSSQKRTQFWDLGLSSCEVRETRQLQYQFSVHPESFL